MESNNNTGLGSCLSKQLKIYPEKLVNINIPSSAFTETFPAATLPTTEPTLANAQFSYTVTDADLATFTPSIKSFMKGLITQFGFKNNATSSRTITIKLYKNGFLVDTQISGSVAASGYVGLLYYPPAYLNLAVGDVIQITMYASGAIVSLNYINRVCLPMRIKLEDDNTLLYNITLAGFNNYFNSTLTPINYNYNSQYYLKNNLNPANVGYMSGESSVGISTWQPVGFCYNHPLLGALQYSHSDISSYVAWTYNASYYPMCKFWYPAYIKYQPSNIKINTRAT